MRLLKFDSHGELSLTKDLIQNVPPYAILSHTWGADEDEITFDNLKEGSTKGKAGYEKILFCGKQARKDGLHYFWVDTCCINKSNNAELSEAIISMFRWYRDAAECYVYLSDVTTDGRTQSEASLQPWEPAFRENFFCSNGHRLGNKDSLEGQLHEIPGIPVSALHGAALSGFDVHERLLWAESRETKREEDKAYSLLGIFNVVMPVLYGEGKESAFRRLRQEISAPEPQKTGFGTEHPHLKDSREMLETLHNTYKRVFYVIDGLDECSLTERNEILDIMLSLQQLRPQETKLMLSSRKTQDLLARMSGFNQIYVSAEANSADILGFVSQEIDTAVKQSRLLNGRVSTELQAEIVNRLAENARGMFLWAKLQIPVLCAANTKKRVHAALASYPKTLDQQYERMIVAIQSQENDRTSLAFDILRWITFALRPLKLDELWTVLLADRAHESFDGGDLDPGLATDMCQNFLYFDTSLNQLGLLHTSARQYLQQWFGNARGHGYLATQCARYLTDCGFDQEVEGALKRYIEPEEVCKPPPRRSSSPAQSKEFRDLLDAIQRIVAKNNYFSSIRDTYCFLEYAGSFWLQHVDKGMEHFSLSYFPWILDAKSGIFSMWRNLNGFKAGLVLHALGELALQRLEKQNKEPGIIHIAAHLGLENLLSHVLELVSEVKHKQEALAAAASEGIDNVVRTLLLDTRVITPPGVFSALVFASATSHISVVKMILTAAKECLDGENFNDIAVVANIGACLSPKEDMMTAVRRICGDSFSEFNYDMVKHVVSLSENYHVDTNSPSVKDLESLNNLMVTETCGLQGWSTLMISALSGNEKVVPIIFALLSWYGNVKTIMGKVAASGHVALFKKLVSKGFKCTIQDDEGKTPLHRAVEENQVEIVKSLLEILKPEDVGIEDADGERALDIAVRQGLDEITVLLDPFSSAS
ncbi:MAG: hypothetical protein Q9167_007462 [Letrouitia subvulpina]